ncbi:hypothetical protein EAE99_011295 [Botrytis elliptica]|nr:hypothetical protein EAE99_011295 [Botrytis elliptica]
MEQLRRRKLEQAERLANADVSKAAEVKEGLKAAICEAVQHIFNTKHNEDAEILSRLQEITDAQKQTQENVSKSVEQLITYQQDNTQLLQKIENLEEQVRCQSQNLSTLTEKLDQQHKDSESVWKTINVESVSIQETHNTLAANVSTIGGTKATLESNTKTLTDLSEEIRGIVTSVAAMERKANEKINDISPTMDVLERLQTQLDETVTKATNTANFMNNLGTTITNTTGCLTTNTTVLEDIKKSLSLSKEDITEKLTTASNINLSTNRESAQITMNLSKITTNLSQNLEILNASSASIVSCAQSVQKLEEESGERIRSSVRGVEGLEQNMKSLTTSIDSCVNNIQKLEQKSGEDFKSGVTGLDKLRQDFQSLMASIQTCVENVRQMEETTISNINVRTKKLDQLSENTKSTTQTLEKIQAKADSNISNLSKCFNNLEEITKNLSSNEERLTMATSEMVTCLAGTSADLTKSTTAVENIKETINSYSRTMEDTKVALEALNAQMENELKTICEESAKLRMDLGIKKIDQGKLIWEFIGEKFETGYKNTTKEISGVSELIKTFMNEKKSQETVERGIGVVQGLTPGVTREAAQGVAQDEPPEAEGVIEVGRESLSEISDKRPRSNGDDTDTPGTAKRHCNNERQSPGIKSRWVSIFIDGPAGQKQKKGSSLASSQIPIGIQDLIHERRMKIKTRPDNVDLNKDRPRVCFMSQYFPSSDWPESIDMPR